MTLYRFFRLGSWLLSLIRLALLLHWFLRLFRVRNQLTDWLDRFLGPILEPFRRLSETLMARTGVGLDFSYVFAIIGLTFVERVWMLLYRILR